MIKMGIVLAAAVTLAACAGQQGLLPGPAATSAEGRDCVVMGYRVGTAQHVYCVQVLNRRLSPEEYY